MITPEPEVRRSSGVPGGCSPSACASVRRTRTCTRVGLSFSARLFMWSLSRAMSAGTLLLLLSVQSWPPGGGVCAPTGTARLTKSRETIAMRVRCLGIATPPCSQDRPGWIEVRLISSITRSPLAPHLADQVRKLRDYELFQGESASVRGAGQGVEDAPLDHPSLGP